MLIQFFNYQQPGSSHSFPPLTRFQNSRASFEPEPKTPERVPLVMGLVTTGTEILSQQISSRKRCSISFFTMSLISCHHFHWTSPNFISQKARIDYILFCSYHLLTWNKQPKHVKYLTREKNKRPSSDCFDLSLEVHL